MTIKRRVCGTTEEVFMPECPCGYEFSPGENRDHHFRKDHDPEDFGLTPVGDRDGD